ncbi:MAG: hypothetical protein CMO55_12915 [Verrucomicrobiales bacterium]|nr:hypothetical protein [Verrucomicrobiales bacterium]
MGPDDIGEKRQGSNTPFIALGVAVILLLVVVVISLNDFLRSRLEKEYEVKEKELYSRYGYVPEGMVRDPAMQAGQPAANPQVLPGQTSAGSQTPANAQPATGQATQAPVVSGVNPQLNRAADQMGIESTLPSPEDPELEALRSTLDQVRAEGQRIEEQYNRISKGEDSRPLNSEIANNSKELSTDGIGDLEEELPEFLREALKNPPGGNPSVEEEMERYRVQIRNAPALAKVMSYDKDWGVVTFDAGPSQGVRVNQRFAVRRGEKILGWIKVDEVSDRHSFGTLTTKNKNIDTAAKPEVGDDLIDFEIY